MTTEQLFDQAVAKKQMKDALLEQASDLILQHCHCDMDLCIGPDEYMDYTCPWHEAYYDLLEAL